MSWYDIVGYIILVLLAIGFIVAFPLALRTNLVNGHAYRKKLAAAINSIPLGKMLNRLDIKEAKYLHQQDGLKMNQQISRCNTCNAKNECGDDLEKESSLDISDIDYCPNQTDLQEILKTTRK